jgi:hypothetical protein
MADMEVEGAAGLLGDDRESGDELPPSNKRSKVPVRTPAIKTFVHGQIRSGADNKAIVRRWKRNYKEWESIANDDILPKIQTQRRNLRNNDAKEAIGAEAIDAAQEKRQERQAELDRKREELSNAMNDTRERCDDALSVAEKLGNCGFDEGPHVLSLNQLQKSYQELSFLGTMSPVPEWVRISLPKVVLEIRRVAELVGTTDICDEVESFLRGYRHLRDAQFDAPFLPAKSVPVGPNPRRFDRLKLPRKPPVEKICRPRRSLSIASKSASKKLSKANQLMLVSDIPGATEVPSSSSGELTNPERSARQAQLEGVQNEIDAGVAKLLPLLRLRTRLESELNPSDVVTATSESPISGFATASIALIARPLSPARQICGLSSATANSELRQLFDAMNLGYLRPIPGATEPVFSASEDEASET